MTWGLAEALQILKCKDISITPSSKLHQIITRWTQIVFHSDLQWSGLPWWLRRWRICLQCRRPGFGPQIRMIPGSGGGHGNPVHGSYTNTKIQCSMCVAVTRSCLTLFQPHGLQPARLLCPWDSPGKNTGVSGHALLQGNLPDPGMEPRSPALQADTLPSEPPGKP